MGWFTRHLNQLIDVSGLKASQYTGTGAAVELHMPHTCLQLIYLQLQAAELTH
jgi:hypothetical protein